MRVSQFRVKSVLVKFRNYLSSKNESSGNFIDDSYYDVPKSDKYVVTNGDVPY